MDYLDAFQKQHERTGLIPCVWRTVYAWQFEERPLDFSYHLTCPVCKAFVDNFVNLQAEDFLSPLCEVWYAGLVYEPVERKGTVVLFSKRLTDRLVSFLLNANLAGFPLMFRLEEGLERVEVIPLAEKVTDMPPVKVQVARNYEKIFSAWLAGNVGTVYSLKRNTDYLLLFCNDDYYQWYFVGYYFHRVEEFPFSQMMELAPLYAECGLTGFDCILRKLRKEGEDAHGETFASVRFVEGD